jgi:multisubunit Na+/H+ antiporter MnhE subunit
MHPTLTFLVETCCWGAVSCGVWLTTLSGVTYPELWFAVGAGVPCGVLGAAGRRALGGSWRLRWAWALWPAAVAATLLAETGALFAAAVRGPCPGRLTTVELPAETPELSSGREAAATLALCSTPGSIVTDSDPEAHRLTVHALLSAGPDLRAVVRR